MQGLVGAGRWVELEAAAEVRSLKHGIGPTHRAVPFVSLGVQPTSQPGWRRQSGVWSLAATRSVDGSVLRQPRAQVHATASPCGGR